MSFEGSIKLAYWVIRKR